MISGFTVYVSYQSTYLIQSCLGVSFALFVCSDFIASSVSKLNLHVSDESVQRSVETASKKYWFLRCFMFSFVYLFALVYEFQFVLNICFYCFKNKIRFFKGVAVRLDDEQLNVDIDCGQVWMKWFGDPVSLTFWRKLECGRGFLAYTKWTQRLRIIEGACPKD